MSRIEEISKNYTKKLETKDEDIEYLLDQLEADLKAFKEIEQKSIGQADKVACLLIMEYCRNIVLRERIKLLEAVAEAAKLMHHTVRPIALEQALQALKEK